MRTSHKVSAIPLSGNEMLTSVAATGLSKLIDVTDGMSARVSLYRS